MTPKIVTVVILAFFPIMLNTMLGVRSVEPGHHDVMRSLNADKWATFWRLEYHSTMPYVVAGMEIGIVFAIIGAVLGEYLGGDEGLGYLIILNLNNLNEAPVVGDQSFTVWAGSGTGAAAGTVQASDPDAGQTLTYAITAGNTPCLIFNGAQVATPQYVEMGGLVPLDSFPDGAEYINSRSGTEIADQYKSPDGTYYQIPWKANPVMLFYNKDMFRAAGLDPDDPPETWQELEEAAMAMTEMDALGIDRAHVREQCVGQPYGRHVGAAPRQGGWLRHRAYAVGRDAPYPDGLHGHRRAGQQPRSREPEPRQGRARPAHGPAARGPWRRHEPA